MTTFVTKILAVFFVVCFFRVKKNTNYRHSYNVTILNKFNSYFYRPAFLPDPNDGSLYSLGGKNNEGLTVRDLFFIFHEGLPHSLESKGDILSSDNLRKEKYHFEVKRFRCFQQKKKK